MLEITEEFLNPAFVESTEVEDEPEDTNYEAENITEQVEQALLDGHTTITQTVIVDDTTEEPKVGFSFMQESELDNEPTSFENGAEWIEKEDAIDDSANQTFAPETNGHPVETVVAVEVKN